MITNKIYHGTCLEVLKTFEDNCLDSCVTDPPYGINFMNKHWDYDVPKVEVWKEVLRVLKPGGHLLCACGTRTQHRMAVNIEDAGFEIRDVITWHYGSGFPKSLDVSKAIDKQAGVEREVIGQKSSDPERFKKYKEQDGCERTIFNNSITVPTSEAAKEYEGWGTALKPATEFWTLARKPLSENTVAENVLKYGTGGINIDGSRIGLQSCDNKDLRVINRNIRDGDDGWGMQDNEADRVEVLKENGRFPANVIFDEFAGDLLDKQTGTLTSGTVSPEGFKGEYTAQVYGKYANNQINPETVYGDSGGASRFFYCPKADNFERNKGLKGFDTNKTIRPLGISQWEGQTNGSGDIMGASKPQKNFHPTVKPIDLMRYLVKLITPKKGVCLDPYCGSGTTLIGCKLELINYIGIEREEEYCKIAEARVAAWNPDKYIPQTLF